MLVSDRKIVDISKKSSLQFLPESLKELSENDSFYFKCKKLKTDYVIDLVHNILLKYYFRKENSFNLSSLILKEKYGHLYNYYVDYLKSIGILILIKNYLKGSNTKVYSLNISIFSSKIYRFKNKDKFLIKKYVKKQLSQETSVDNRIRRDIKSKLISDLNSVSIEYDKALFYLNSIRNKDIDTYQRNKYSIDSINQNHIFYHFDEYGRMHSNFTILKSFIRKSCLLIDGEETCEIDIKNSQPLFLSKLISDSGTHWVDESEYQLFSILVQSGNFYQHLMDNLRVSDRNDVKNITYKVFFGQNRKNSLADRMFSKLFPTIYNFIRLYKVEYKNYRILAYDLQRAESELIFNQIISKIMIINCDIKIITIHDSIIVQSKYRDMVSDIFFSEIFNHFDKI